MPGDYSFTMPYPPSVNAMWRAFKSRVILSKRGREYRKLAVESLAEQGVKGELICSNISMVITLNPPTLRRYDIDNYCKGVLDALTYADFWFDDEQVHKLKIIKGEKVKGGRVDVSIDLI